MAKLEVSEDRVNVIGEDGEWFWVVTLCYGILFYFVLQFWVMAIFVRRNSRGLIQRIFSGCRIVVPRSRHAGELQRSSFC